MSEIKDEPRDEPIMENEPKESIVEDIKEDSKKVETKLGETKDAVLSEFKQTNIIQVVIGSAIGWLVWMMLDKTVENEEEKRTEVTVIMPEQPKCNSFWTVPPEPVEAPVIPIVMTKRNQPRKVSFWT